MCTVYTGYFLFQSPYADSRDESRATPTTQCQRKTRYLFKCPHHWETVGWVGGRSGAEGRIPERHVCAPSQAAGGSRLPGGMGRGIWAEAGGPVTYQLRPSVAQGQSREAALECVSFPLKVKSIDAHTQARTHAKTERAAVGSCCFHAHARMNMHATHSRDLRALNHTYEVKSRIIHTHPAHIQVHLFTLDGNVIRIESLGKLCCTLYKL